MKPSAPSPAVRRQLIALLLVTAGLSILGGLLLAARPDGRLLRLSPELLESTSFGTFLVPGLVLAAVVGGTQLLAGLAVVRHHPRGLTLGVIAGLVLAGWIAIQALMIGGIIWLQPLFFGVAVVELMLVAANVPRGRARR